MEYSNFYDKYEKIWREIRDVPVTVNNPMFRDFNVGDYELHNTQR